VNIDYMLDDDKCCTLRNAFIDKNGDDPYDAWDAGWRAACEAMHKKAQAKAAPDWRAACVVEKCEDGDWDVVSPSGEFWLYEVRPCWMGFDDSVKRSKIGSFGCEISARAALAACPTPPPDWEGSKCG
jgi:hypothetical protein